MSIPPTGNTLDSTLAQFLKLAATVEGRPVSTAAPDSPIEVELPTFDPFSFLSSSLVSQQQQLQQLQQQQQPHESYIPMNSQTESSSSSLESLRILFSLQGAAAALNLPWTRELESAAMAMSPAAQTWAQRGTSVSSISSVSVQPPSAGSTSPMKRSRSQFSKASSSPSNHAESEFEDEGHTGEIKQESVERDEDSELLARRAKNTDAARRSRLKKMMKLDTLEAKVKELEGTNHRLNMRIAVLETEKTGYVIREAEQGARIAQLEAKIVEAHLALTNRNLH